MTADPSARFWDVASPLLEHPGVTKSTMMGFACLRFHGDFFATCDHRSGDLVVKLTEDRVHELIGAGRATNFAPAGRPFREWASVSTRRARSWPALLDEALECSRSRVGGERPPATANRAPRR